MTGVGIEPTTCGFKGRKPALVGARFSRFFPFIELPLAGGSASLYAVLRQLWPGPKAFRG